MPLFHLISLLNTLTQWQPHIMRYPSKTQSPSPLPSINRRLRLLSSAIQAIKFIASLPYFACYVPLVISHVNFTYNTWYVFDGTVRFMRFHKQYFGCWGTTWLRCEISLAFLQSLKFHQPVEVDPENTDIRLSRRSKMLRGV